MAWKVIFVDDEPDTLALFKRVAEPLGCEVLTLADSQQAASVLKNQKFDGVFLDARMPHPDGFELAQIVRASSSNFGTPVTMLTGDDTAETMLQAFKSGVTFFLGKPLTASRLTAALRTMRGAMQREKRRYARLPFRAVVACRLGGKLYKSHSVNISEGGMLIETSVTVSTGQELDLEFVMPKASQPLKPRAKVVRKESQNQMAVQFVALKDAELHIIQEYLSGKLTE